MVGRVSRGAHAPTAEPRTSVHTDRMHAMAVLWSVFLLLKFRKEKEKKYNITNYMRLTRAKVFTT